MPQTEPKIYTYQNAEEAKEWIGKEGYFSDNLKELNTLEDPACYRKDVLESVANHSSHPFERDYHNWYQFFRPIIEPVKKWVPFTKDDDTTPFIGKLVQHKRSKGIHMVMGVEGRNNGDILIGIHWETLKTMFVEWVIYGTDNPFGKEMVE